jgi:hypothetical protein
MRTLFSSFIQTFIVLIHAFICNSGGHLHSCLCASSLAPGPGDRLVYRRRHPRRRGWIRVLPSRVAWEFQAMLFADKRRENVALQVHCILTIHYWASMLYNTVRHFHWPGLQNEAPKIAQPGAYNEDTQPCHATHHALGPMRAMCGKDLALNEPKLANPADRGAVAMSWPYLRRCLPSALTHASLRMDEQLAIPPRAGALVVLAHRSAQ